MKKLLAALIFSSCFAVNAQGIKTLEQELTDEIGRVDFKTGITREQAKSIAQYYCHQHIAGCGTAQAVIDRGSDWEITPVTGVAGVSDKNSIAVDKHTGNVSWGKGPVLRLTELINSKETAPEPTNKNDRKPQHSPSSKVKIQFSVSPAGSVADVRFRKSSKNLKCDLAAKRSVEGWRFPPRKRPIVLVADVETCSQ